MTNDEAQRLDHGIYRLTWDTGGTSVASVGSLHDGTRWHLPTNWTGDGRIEASTNWSQVVSAKLLIPGVIDRTGDAAERRRNQRDRRRRSANR